MSEERMNERCFSKPTSLSGSGQKRVLARQLKCKFATVSGDHTGTRLAGE